MAYVALYRAYRPQKFSEVVGQQHIIKTLQNAIKLNKVAHAYLFCGPRGTGKTTLAKIMAKALNCEHGPSIEPCDECEICKGIQKGTISDVVEIDAASNNGADDIRSLIDSVKYLPSKGRCKVYIIDEVHMLSNAAFNALLKTLEEPPKHVIFILATTEPYKLPNTILSRCQRFDFQAITQEDILKRLQIVANAENIKMTNEAFSQIANAADGGMRDALSLFDQTISYTTNPEITLDDVLAVSGNISYKMIIKLLQACLDGNGALALTLVDGILKEGKEVPRIINDIIMFLRDSLLYKNNVSLDSALESQDKEFGDFCKNISKGVIYEWLNNLNESNSNMRFSNQKRAYLELALLKMSDTKLNEEYNLVDRIKELENTIHMLSLNKPSDNSPKNVVETKLPSKEEIKELRTATETVQIEEFKENPLEVNIKEVEVIINSASKQLKLELQEIWSRIANDYAGVFEAQILVAGELVAVNEDSFIVVLNDLAFCNRLMRYENYEKIMEILSGYNSKIKEYICIPKAVWLKIKADYISKYTKENPIVKLTPIAIGVLKRKVPTEEIKTDEDLDKIYDLIDKNKVEIMEE